MSASLEFRGIFNNLRIFTEFKKYARILVYFFIKQMLNKDFENFELRLVKLKEESLEDFSAAEKVFDDIYKARLEEIFPRDVL
jgi:hypothetical protein